VKTRSTCDEVSFRTRTEVAQRRRRRRGKMVTRWEIISSSDFTDHTARLVCDAVDVN